MAALLSTTRRHVAWRPRRRFDPAVAQAEGVWTATSAGHDLTFADRQIEADIFFHSEAVFETGVGESTKIATFTGVPRYTGVDNAVEWLNAVMEKAPSHYRFHWADIGKISMYSVPTDDKARPKWPLSSMAALAAEDEPFDFYLVDGRFRVASIAACMLHALMRGKRDALFAIHDYGYEDPCGRCAGPAAKKTISCAPGRHLRDFYNRVEELGTIVRGVGVDDCAQLAVLKMKPGLTAADCITVWRDFQYDSR